MDITQCLKFHRNGVSDAVSTTEFQVKLSAQCCLYLNVSGGGWYQQMQ